MADLTMIDPEEPIGYIEPMTTNSNTPFSQVENVASRASEGVMYAGAAGSGVAWALSAEGIIALTGLFIAVVGFFANLYFSIKRDKRQRELHELQVKRLKQKKEDTND